ncbi:transcriptional repressor AgaR [Ravibacter arvi]|uniref:Transcriptional repressor AgaR n=1 Tax=Ravibacter arvi TaxID=2051041 RepID=A0ABP8LT84_9BACT
MTITERHQYILGQLQRSGRVSIQELCEQIQVSGVTIRKDLKLLEERNLLFRTHGGASLQNPYALERPIQEKQFINALEKKQIALATCTLLANHDALMIGSGTTVFEFARNLVPNNPITVITPALKVALELSERKNVEVLQLGGIIRQNSSSVAGAFAEYMLATVSCGILFLGVDGIDLEFGFTISNLTEAGLNQKMIESAQSVAILADHTKFGKRGIAKICDFDAVHYVVTDSQTAPEAITSLEESGIKVIVG